MLISSCKQRLDFSKTVYCLTRICTSPNAVPVLEGEQRRYITLTGEARVSWGEVEWKGSVQAPQPSTRLIKNGRGPDLAQVTATFI